MLPSRCSCCRSASVSRTTSLTSTVARVECRLRANVSRCRTMRAARSASWRIVSSPCLISGPGLPARHPLGPHQDRGERVVQLVGDAGDGLAEHRHLLGLQELLVEVARLFLELPALADVAEQRVDLQRVGRRPGLRLAGDLDPQGGAVGAAEPQEVVGDGAVAAQPLEQRRPRRGIDETGRVERADVLGRGVGGVAEEQSQVGVGGAGGAPRVGQRSEVDALVHHLEEARVRVRRQAGCAHERSDCNSVRRSCGAPRSAVDRSCLFGSVGLERFSRLTVSRADPTLLVELRRFEKPCGGTCR